MSAWHYSINCFNLTDPLNLLAGCTGLRISQVLGLRWRSVDFEGLAMAVTEAGCEAKQRS